MDKQWTFVPEDADNHLPNNSVSHHRRHILSLTAVEPQR